MKRYLYMLSCVTMLSVFASVCRAQMVVTIDEEPVEIIRPMYKGMHQIPLSKNMKQNRKLEVQSDCNKKVDEELCGDYKKHCKQKDCAAHGKHNKMMKHKKRCYGIKA